MSAVEELETIRKDTEIEEVDAVLPESLSNGHDMENMDVKDGQECDSRLEEMCTHSPEVRFVSFTMGRSHAYRLSIKHMS